MIPGVPIFMYHILTEAPGPTGDHGAMKYRLPVAVFREHLAVSGPMGWSRR
jgi:hypothetical protein